MNMDSRNFDGLWGFLHVHLICMRNVPAYMGGGVGLQTQGKQGSRCILLTVMSFMRDTHQDNKTKGDVL